MKNKGGNTPKRIARNIFREFPFKSFWKKFEPYFPESRDFLLRKIPKGAVCVEIGVWEGKLSERILRIVKPSALYLIDPWMADLWKDPNGIGGGKYTQEAQDKRYELIKSRFKGKALVLRSTSDEALDMFGKEFHEESLDFVYIDGDHSYEQVKKDIGWWGEIKQGGILAGDDFRLPGVRRAVEESGHVFQVKNDQWWIKK